MKIDMKQILLLVICAFVMILPINAQRMFTLDECLEEALNNNARLKNAENNLLAAKHSSREAFTKYFPVLSASGGGFMSDKGLIQMELQPGTEMSMLKNGIVGGVFAAMPLFAGGQIVNGNRLAEIGVEVSRLQRNQSINEVLLTTEQYFWQVVMLKEKLKTLDALEVQLKRMHDDVQTSVEAGITTRNDLLQVQLRENEIESGRIQVENLLNVSYSLLAQYIGHSKDSIDVAFTMVDSLPDNPEELYRSPESSLFLTNEYHLLRQNVQIARLQHKLAIGKNLPTVSIGGGYVYDNFMDYDQSFWVGFATISVPLSGWWGGTHDIKKQKLQVRNAENQFSDQSEQLLIRMQHTWNDLNDAFRQVKIAKLSIEQSSENLRLNTDYYTSGTCSISDLLDAQTLYRQSRDKYVEAYAQYEVKKREYLQATGR